LGIAVADVVADGMSALWMKVIVADNKDVFSDMDARMNFFVE